MASELWERLRFSGLQELAPALCDAGVLSLYQVSVRKEELISSGVSRQQIDKLLGATTADPKNYLDSPANRRDLPAIPVRKRASFQASLEAALPENRAASLRRLHEGFLATSSTGPISSRVRTWHEWCRSWGCVAFPLDHHNISCCAASMKDGSYRSCAQYFSAVVKHQERELRLPVSDLLKGLIADCKRSILRGLGTEQLKDAFDVWALRPLLEASNRHVRAWHADDVYAMADALLLASWFMWREVELSNLRRSHIYLEGRQVFVLLAVQKTDTQGSLMTRSLKCCCVVQQHVFCPFHAAARHLRRLDMFEEPLGKRASFAFPSPSGLELSKAKVVASFRMVLSAVGVPLHRPDEADRPMPRFHGHCARVSGAQWLISLGLALHLVMLLGRWSSAAIQKYVQSTPLLQLPSATTSAFQGFTPTAGLDPAGLSGSASSGAPPSDSQPTDSVLEVLQELSTLQEEVAFLKQAARAPSETFVRSVRSLLVHKVRVNELSNPPRRWKTICGWPYGLRNFMRVPLEEVTDDKKCQRCWDPVVNAVSSSSSSSSSGSTNLSADAESSSDVDEYD